MKLHNGNRHYVLAVMTAAVIALGAITHAQTAGQRGGTNEGVGIHGHWVIEVHNADGSLAERREFDNALIQTTATVAGGNSAMAGLLIGRFDAASWGFRLATSAAQPGSGPCSGSTACSTLFSGASLPTADDEAGHPIPTGSFALSGQVQAASDGSIGWVTTTLGSHGVSTQFSFSGRDISPAIQVRNGQFVQLTVTYSFS